MSKSTTDMISESKTYYESLGSVYCPTIKENILFNHYGWKHLRYDGHGHKRPEKRFVTMDGLTRTASYIEVLYQCDTPKGARNITVVLRKFEIGSFHYYSIR